MDLLRACDGRLVGVQGFGPQHLAITEDGITAIGTLCGEEPDSDWQVGILHPEDGICAECACCLLDIQNDDDV